jgi:hypothetical protein
MSYSKNDILSALGMETEVSWLTFALAGFGVGCLVGAATAILLAPKSGRELRDDIMERGRSFMQRGREKMEEKMPNTPPSY